MGAARWHRRGCDAKRGLTDTRKLLIQTLGSSTAWLSARPSATFPASTDSTVALSSPGPPSREAPVTEPVKTFVASLPAVSKHLEVLERPGPVSRGGEARRRPRPPEGGPLKEAAGRFEGRAWGGSLTVWMGARGEWSGGGIG